MRWLPLSFAAATTIAVVAACSSSDDKTKPATPDAATYMPDRPVNEVVDGGSCPDAYPKPGPEVLTRTPPVDQAVEAIYAIRPDLKYINKLKREYAGNSGSIILPFEVAGGFDIVMVRADGCTSSCTTFEYWYFEVRGAEPTWTATDVGHFLPPSPNACDSDAGTPMWNSPVARACDDGGGPAPAITGTRAFCATGSLGTCTAATPTTRPVTIDFGANTVTVHGTGSPSLDEKTFDATFGRNEVHATVNRASEACPMISVRIDLDLGPGGVGEIELDETLCADGGPTATCRALTHLELVEAVAP